MVATEEYHSTSSHNTSISFDLLPEGPDNDAVSEMRDELVKNAGDWPMLRKRLTKVFGGDTALFLEYLIFWSGKSHAPHGWVWKSRDEIEDLEKGTGQGHREQEKARKILRGDKQRDGRTFRVVEECRPSRRRATFYRVDLVAVANIIGVELLSSIEDDLDFFGLEESESPHGATQNGQTPDKPSESPHEATESPHGTTESPHGAASVDTSLDTYSSSTLQVVGEPAFAEPPTTNGKRKKEKAEQPLTTEHPSQNGHTPSETTAVKDEVEQVVAPAKPDDDALLAEVKEILDAESGRWWGAANIAKHKDTFTAEKVAGYIITNAVDIKRPEVVTSAPRDELVQAVEYVQWEAVA
jgi:hypothetical protein